MDLVCVFFCLVFAMPLCASVYTPNKESSNAYTFV